MVGVYIKKLIEDGALKEDFSIELLGIYPLKECLLREEELAKTSLFPKGLNGNAGYYIEMTDEVREKMSKNNLKRVLEGTHNFLGPEMQRKRVLEGTHPFLGPEMNRKRVLEGTHPFLGPEHNRKRIEDGTHNFLNSDFQRRTQQKRVKKGTHTFLGKGLMSVYDKVEHRIISRIHKDEYHQNKDRYLNLNSNEYKKIKAASIEAQTQIENN